jgi:hypothetical protein
MGWFRWSVGRSWPVLTALLAGAIGAGAAEPQADAAAPAVHKSVYGKLETVDTRLNGVIIRSDAGERMAWRFDAKVVAALAPFKIGDPVIVIYRQTTANEKAVTAIAFPGTAEKPTYINETDSRVVLRSAPMVEGVCGNPQAAPVSEFIIPVGGKAEALDACWCCATAGDSCTPANKSGNGQAVLVRCYKSGGAASP